MTTTRLYRIAMILFRKPLNNTPESDGITKLYRRIMFDILITLRKFSSTCYTKYIVTKRH